jgi:signal transduction histidine kinase/CheY-like chemotaxis protein
LAVHATAGTSAEGSLFREFQRIAVALSAERDLDRLLDLIVTKCREVTTADAGSLYLVEDHGVQPDPGEAAGRAALRFVVAQNDSRRLDLRATSLPLDPGSIAGYVALTRQTLNLPDVYRLPPDVAFTFNSRSDRAFAYRTVSVLAVPMVDHTGTIIGVVQVINKKDRPAVRLDTPDAAIREARSFTARDDELVTALASLAAVAIQGRRAEDTRTQLENQLRHAQKMDAVGRLAGGIAHDFNNLLMVIRGRSELLARRVGADSPLRRHVDLVRETAERAAVLTQQLLTFSRKQVIQPKLVSLNEVVAGVAAMLRRLIGEHIELVVTPDPNLGRTRADQGQLEQAIMNLAVNARDAMPAGGRLALATANAELREDFARTHPGARAGSYVMLSVQDTGVGMDAETKAHLFEPFFTTKEPGKGTGLGLATVYGVVKQHAGYVTVDTREGAGTTFALYLPRSHEEETPAPPPGPAATAFARGSETVLLVEDEQSVRELVREMLEARGYTVLEARHGAQALVVAEAHAGPIHALVTDVVMPQMGGPELVTRLRPLRPGLRVLYISGYPADPGFERDPGQDARLLAKPFTADALASWLRDLLDGPGG